MVWNILSPLPYCLLSLLVWKILDWVDACDLFTRLLLLLDACFMQFDEQKDQVAIEQILRVVFLQPERPCPVSNTVYK